MMKTKETDKYQQSRNILRAYSYIASKGVVSLKELSEHLYPDISELRSKKQRSIQRIADILVQESFVTKIIRPRNQGNLYKINKKISSNTSELKLSSGEILSFNFVKAFMKGFRNTSLADDFENLSNKIDAISSDEFLPEDTLLTFQQPGAYETNLNRELLLFLLRCINEKIWIKINYKSQYSGKVKESEVLPLHLSIYEGIIYLIAHNPSANRYLVHSAYNILDYVESPKQDHRFIEFDIEKFRKERFGIIDGELIDVTLKIKKEIAKYFENRKWHISQNVRFDPSGNLILNFKSPIEYDLITWIIRWGEAIIEIEPAELKDKVIARLQENLKNLK